MTTERAILLRLGPAARRLGIHPATLRLWATTGKIPFVWVSHERRFRVEDVDSLVRGGDVHGINDRVVGYVRVSGTPGQETSLAAQEADLRERYGERLVAIYKDKGSGLNEKRRGLTRLIEHAEDGRFGVVAVTHRDRLARFGVGWIERLLIRDGVRIEVLQEKGSPGGMAELLEDFMSLVATFAGRMYGIRSRETKRRLLSEAGQEINHAQDD